MRRIRIRGKILKRICALIWSTALIATGLNLEKLLCTINDKKECLISE